MCLNTLVYPLLLHRFLSYDQFRMLCPFSSHPCALTGRSLTILSRAFGVLIRHHHWQYRHRSPVKHYSAKNQPTLEYEGLGY